MNRRSFVSTFLASAALVVGCESRRERTPQPRATSAVPADKSQYIVMIVPDLSGSFAHHMADDGRAWEFGLLALDKYFRTRLGNRHDRIIVGQVSASSEEPLIWEGTPEQFRRDFDAKKFREFLLAHSNPHGSMIHDGIVNAMAYMMRIANVRSGKAKSAVLILSDFLDNGPDPEKSEQRLFDQFVAYDKLGGVGGVWYCHQTRYQKWRKKLDDAGLEDFIIECDFKGHPTLPDFR